MGDFLGLFRGFLGNFGGVLVLNFFIISANFSAGFGVSGGGGFLVDFVIKFPSSFNFEIFLILLVEGCRPRWVIRVVLFSTLTNILCL